MRWLIALTCGLMLFGNAVAAQSSDDAQQAADRLVAQVQAGELDQDKLTELLATLGDDDQLTAATVERLAALTQHDRTAIQQAAVKALTALGPQSPDAIRALAELLAADEPALRNQAAAALEQLDAAPSPVLQAAVALRSPNSEVRFQAAKFLSQFGPRAALAQAALVRLALDDATHVSVRWEAIATLRALGKDGAAPLAEVARRSEKGVTYKALEALIHLGPDAAAAVPELRQLVQHEDPRARLRAIKTISAIGPAAIDARPELTQAMSDADAEVRTAAEQALQEIMP